MFSRLAVFLFALAALSMIVFAAGGNAALGDSTGQDQKAVFTNQDVEKYKLPSDSEARQQQSTRKDGKKNGAQKKEEQQDKEYWCKKATHYKKKLETAQDEAGRQEERLEELKDAAFKELGRKRKAFEEEIKKTQKKLKVARRQVKDRRRDMDRIEEEAHRKGIPPGWLRCQYTW